MIDRPAQPDAPLFAPVDPHVRRRDREDRAAQACKVLARLAEGPATAHELVAASGGFRVAARVHDINEHFERTNDPRRIVGEYVEGRVYRYRIEGGTRGN